MAGGSPPSAADATPGTNVLPTKDATIKHPSSRRILVPSPIASRGRHTVHGRDGTNHVELTAGLFCQLLISAPTDPLPTNSRMNFATASSFTQSGTVRPPMEATWM
jgi:hypothetical protein